MNNWIQSAYLYIVATISLVVTIIGLITILNLVVRQYMFGIQGEWYEDPRHSCEWIFMDDTYHFAKIPIPEGIEADSLEDMTTEDKWKYYEHCIQWEEKTIAKRQSYETAGTMSRGIATLLVALPIFLFHSGRIKKLQK